jgi:nucleotide-binding universal stress UspA family protein
MVAPDASTAQVSEAVGVHVTKHELGGIEALKALSRFLELNPADLLVFGVHQREGLERLLRPSLSRPLARQSQAPALFVSGAGRGFVDRQTGAPHLRNVLIPADYAPHPGSAIALAIDLSALLGEDTRFHLLHVGEEPLPIPAGYRNDDRMRVIRTSGPIVEGIVETAHGIGADLIVMATQGHDGFLDVFRGSTTEQVLRRANRAVLAVPV